jgi:hypothetical protein
MKTKSLFLIFLFFLMNAYAFNKKQLNIKIENNISGAPITIGIPFPKGELTSIDNIRLLNNKGIEILCQTTLVTTWEPADESVKWIWVFFFTEKTSDYVLEYGEGIIPLRSENTIISTNNMRPAGGINVNTGPLSFSINKMGNGFLDEVYLDTNKDGKFSEEELIISSPNNKRGSFLDILDDSGIDMSKATINQVFREKGSGPLHVIFKIVGTYNYERKDNNSSPFIITIHAYAGKPYIKVLHTITYTGIPDKHKIQEGEYALIATQNKKIISNNTSDDKGWMQANDQISSCGLTLNYQLGKEIRVFTPLYDGNWYDKKAKEYIVEFEQSQNDVTSLIQTGPKQNNPLGFSTPTKRIDGFKADLKYNKSVQQEVQKVKGWMDISGSSKGIAIGIKNFFQEYPKEIKIDPKTRSLTGFIWPEDVKAMSFARKHTNISSEMLANFAQGITKTTEFIYLFHNKIEVDMIDKIMDYSLKPPVAHTTPDIYTGSKVYGSMAPVSLKHPEYENALQYKYDWWIFNQNWEAWYSMFDYGDGKTYYKNNKWVVWTDNEPMVDFMYWTNFMRTGKAKYYTAAQNMSKHTMDVDNVHWPKKRNYIGYNNEAIDYWNYKDEPDSTPYLGIGRRHADEHWYALLSAHVWLQGWIACYYITGDQRALEVAKMTGDTYLKRIWGEHDLRGRRLYLSVLNLVELYDATKLEKYKVELDERVNLMLKLQKEQGGNLLLDRYGYSQTYVAQGLNKYYQLTGRKDVKNALVEHAHWVRDVPPLNHKMESYLATIYPLLIGYEFSGNKSFLDEAMKRAELLKVSKLSKKNSKFLTQKEYSEALLNISNLPKDDGKTAIWEMNQGLRVFGWTHAYNIPYLLFWMDNQKMKEVK